MATRSTARSGRDTAVASPSFSMSSRAPIITTHTQ
jgi:hypothetical protein